MAWTAPIQVVVCSIILIVNLGVSSLVGIAFIFFVVCVVRHLSYCAAALIPARPNSPLQIYVRSEWIIVYLNALKPSYPQMMKTMFGLRKKTMVWTDQRAKLIQELLGGMRVIKFFGKFSCPLCPRNNIS
jgi:hypothetical protein